MITRVPQVITPVLTRPIVFKAPVTSAALPRPIVVRDTDRGMAQNAPVAGKAKLKFGIDSILGKDSNESRKPNFEERLGKLLY